MQATAHRSLPGQLEIDEAALHRLLVAVVLKQNVVCPQVPVAKHVLVLHRRGQFTRVIGRQIDDFRSELPPLVLVQLRHQVYHRNDALYSGVEHSLGATVLKRPKSLLHAVRELVVQVLLAQLLENQGLGVKPRQRFHQDLAMFQIERLELVRHLVAAVSHVFQHNYIVLQPKEALRYTPFVHAVQYFWEDCSVKSNLLPETTVLLDEIVLRAAHRRRYLREEVDAPRFQRRLGARHGRLQCKILPHEAVHLGYGHHLVRDQREVLH